MHVSRRHESVSCQTIPPQIRRSVYYLQHQTIRAELLGLVARIASDVLSRNASNPDFELTLLTCSITYVHPQRFRSDVLVTVGQFHVCSHPFVHYLNIPFSSIHLSVCDLQRIRTSSDSLQPPHHPTRLSPLSHNSSKPKYLLGQSMHLRGTLCVSPKPRRGCMLR